MKIIGAGMAGLIAANIFRKHSPVVCEAKSSLPENHSALLRHKSDDIAKATSIPFKKVNIIKEVCYDGKMIKNPSVKMINEYSMKVIGEYQSRSIASMNDELRFISPSDFVEKLSVGCDIKFDTNIIDFRTLGQSSPCISTIPIVVLLKQLQLEDYLNKFDFKYEAIKTINLNIPNCNLYQTIYYPDSLDFPYRVSITGDKVIYETKCHGAPNDILLNDCIEKLHSNFGINPKTIINGNVQQSATFSVMKFGKINKLQNQDELKELIGKITKDFNIYSLGRFATWRNILLDDVLNDVLVIQKLIESKGYYTGK